MALQVFTALIHTARWTVDAIGFWKKIDETVQVAKDQDSSLSAATKVNLYLEGALLGLQAAQIPSSTATQYNLKGIETAARGVSLLINLNDPQQRTQRIVAFVRSLFEVGALGAQYDLERTAEDFAQLEYGSTDENEQVYHYHPSVEEVQARFTICTQLGNALSIGEIVLNSKQRRPRISPSVPSDPLDFVKQSTISELVEEDPIFQKYICPITQGPIRFAVRDRNHPLHIYEKAAILEWLEVNPSSPLSCAPLRPEELEPCLEIQQEIDARLTLYTQKAKNIGELLQDAVKAHLASEKQD